MTDALNQLADRLLGRRDARTAAPGKIDALFALEPGRTLYRPTVHMRWKDYAWLRDDGLIEGDTESCLLTKAGEELQSALRALSQQES
jgi:hypothetical protein